MLLLMLSHAFLHLEFALPLLVLETTLFHDGQWLKHSPRVSKRILSG